MSSRLNDVNFTTSDLQLFTTYTTPSLNASGAGADVIDNSQCPWFHFVVNTLLIGA